MNVFPRFFKVFILPVCSEEMMIPLAFSAHIQDSLPKKALLKNHRGKVWPVKIRNNRNNFYFANGWSEFVKYNDVQNGDFLVFDYDNPYVFNVKIYGKAMCEKKTAQYEEIGDEESEEYMGDESNETYEESKENDEEEEEFEMESMENDEEEEEFEMENKKKGKAKTIKCDKGLKTRKEKGESVRSGKGLQMVLGSSNDDYKGKDAAKTQREFSDASEDEAEVFKYGVIARPTRPYFVTKLRANRKNKLYIPLDVIRDHKLELPKKMTIFDEKNHEWDTSDVKVWGDGRTWLTWKAFRRWNVLRLQDRCLCEFVKDSGPRELFLKIRILRKGSWLGKGDN